MRILTTLTLTGLLLLPLLAQAADTPAGQIVTLKGGVELHSASDDKVRLPKVGDAIYVNDRVVTKADGFAKLLLRDHSILKVSPSSELAVTTQLLGPENANTTINLLKGKLRTLVVERLGATSKFEVHTAVAVAGVRGTDFEVSAGETTEVHCYEGLVNVANIDGAIKGSVLLRPNSYTQVSRGMAPLQPRAIPNTGGQGSQGGGEEGVDTGDLINQLYDDTLQDLNDLNLLYPPVGSNLDLLDLDPLFGDPTRPPIDQHSPLGIEIPFVITIPLP